MLVKKIENVKYIKVFSEFEALMLEAELIRAHKPFFNSIAKDDKSPIYIRISKGPIPLISLTRKEKLDPGVFLKGPFPSAKTTREVLRTIRRIFPYCHHKNAPKPCLYVHLGLCPYPYANEQAILAHRKNIFMIKKLLLGKTKSLTVELKKEMAKKADDQKYEEANLIKRQIEGLEYISSTYRMPPEFLERPTLVDDLTLAKLKDLQNVLNMAKLPARIECYDISNISGKFATGSMVVFTNGVADKDEYRRFRIKFSATPNDYLMLEEVLTRRLKNNWPVADLMIIDGGPGQLNVAVKVVRKDTKIKVISLAKRFELIYTTDKTTPISLPKESSARQLLQAIRDEAHRFAITYHRLLHSKQLLS